MQIGTRWAVGGEPPQSVPIAMRAAIDDIVAFTLLAFSAAIANGGGVGEVLQADQADAAVRGVVDPERGVVLVVPGASVDGVLHVVRGRVRPHVEGPGVLREEGDERRAIISGRIRGREGDGHGGRVGEGGCRDAGESSHDTR